VLFVEPRVKVLELAFIDAGVRDHIAAPQEVGRVVRTPVLVRERHRPLRDIVDDRRDVVGGVQDVARVVTHPVARVEVRDVGDPILVVGVRVRVRFGPLQSAELSHEFVMPHLPPLVCFPGSRPRVLRGPSAWSPSIATNPAVSST